MEKIKKIKDFFTYKETDSVSDFLFRMTMVEVCIYFTTLMLAIIGNFLVTFPACISVLHVIAIVTGFLAFISVILILWIVISLLKGDGVK